MLHKILHHPALAFFVLILVVVAGLWLWAPATFHPSTQASLRDRLDCKTDKFSETLLTTTLAQSQGQIKLLISFDQQPTEDTVARLATQGIVLYPDSWVLDYLIGEAPHESLCALATESQVSFIDIVPSL